MPAQFLIWTPAKPPICAGTEYLHTCAGGEIAAVAFAVTLIALFAVCAARRTRRRVANKLNKLSL
ncbi:MAG: hypothetical protein AAF661_10210 [Pseudomonadota bacterium]